MKTQSDKKSGSVVIAVVVVILIIAALVGGYLRLTVSEHRAAQRNLLYQGAMNIAEAAAEEAFHALNNNDFKSWERNGEGHWSFRLVERFENRETHTMRAVLNNDGDLPRIDAWGTIERGNIEVTRRVEVVYEEFIAEYKFNVDERKPVRRRFVEGFVARKFFDMNGNRVDVDSYNSSLGDYNEVITAFEFQLPNLSFITIDRNRFPNGSIGSVWIIDGSIDVGNANIWGFAMTNDSDPEIGPNGEIRGPDTPSGVKVDGNRIVKDFYADFPLVPHPKPEKAITSVDGAGNDLRLGHPDAPEGAYSVYNLESLHMAGNRKLTVYNDVTLVMDGKLEIRGNAFIEVAPGARLTILSKADVEIAGNGILNAGSGESHPIPADVFIYGTAADEGGQSIHLGGNAIMHASVYAPNADVHLGGGGGGTGGLFGAIVAYTIKINGTYTLHFDEALREPPDAIGDDGNNEIDVEDVRPERQLVSWREVIGVSG